MVANVIKSEEQKKPTDNSYPKILFLLNIDTVYFINRKGSDKFNANSFLSPRDLILRLVPSITQQSVISPTKAVNPVNCMHSSVTMVSEIKRLFKNILHSNPQKLSPLYAYSLQGYRKEGGFEIHRNTSVCLNAPPLVPELQSPKTNKKI